MLILAVCILAGLLMFTIVYIVLMQRQIQQINRQLSKRLVEKTRQPISIPLFSPMINTLTANINKCLKAEEVLRLQGIQKEKKFKELIANVSHDLRTPLTAVKGYQQLLKKGGLSDDQVQKLHIIQKHTQDLGTLIEYFFEYTYLVNAEPELHIERMNVTNLVTECLAEFVPDFEEKNLAIHLKESFPVFVSADKQMVVRIIQNLIRNCMAHADGTIEVQVVAREKAIILFKNSIKDGNEIDVKRVFDRFYTADKARGKTTGLGLSIVKLLAEQQGGNAKASVQGRFFEIEVTLPRSEISVR